MTGTHFLGCKSCGTYDRHNELAQVAFAWFKYELKYSGSTGSFDSNYVGISAKGSSKHTDGQVWGSAQYPGRVGADEEEAARARRGPLFTDENLPMGG